MNIVKFKSYDTTQTVGRQVWDAVQFAVSGVLGAQPPGYSEAQEQARYGEPTLIRPRLGQGAFRIVVTDNYRRRCAISGEGTLPALDAAHIAHSPMAARMKPRMVF